MINLKDRLGDRERKINYSEVVELNKQKYNPKMENDNYKCIELEHLASNTGMILGYTNSINQKSVKNKFNSNSILYGKLRPYLNKYALPNFEGVCSSEILVFQPKAPFTKEYAYYLLQSNRFNKIVENTTGTKMPRLSWKDISNVEFDVYSNEKNYKIGIFLSSIDILIKKQEEYLSELEEQKQGYMQRIFNNEINNENVIKLRENTNSYKGLINKNKSDFEGVTNSKYVQFKNIHDKILYQDFGDVYVAEDEKQNVVLYNDILYTGTSENIEEIGITNIYKLKEEAYLNSFSYGIRLNEKINPDYFYYFTHSKNYRTKIQREGQGITRINISLNRILDMEIGIHILEEQNKIASLLSSMDNFIIIKCNTILNF